MAAIAVDALVEKFLAKSKISSQGQITLPLEIRDRLGVKAGDTVKFVVAADGRTMVLPVREEENPFLKWIGTAPPMKEFGYADSNAWVNDMRDDGYRQADIDEWNAMKDQEIEKAA